jgi:hypothetical protein
MLDAVGGAPDAGDAPSGLKFAAQATAQRVARLRKGQKKAASVTVVISGQPNPFAADPEIQCASKSSGDVHECSLWRGAQLRCTIACAVSRASAAQQGTGRVAEQAPPQRTRCAGSTATLSPRRCVPPAPCSCCACASQWLANVCLAKHQIRHQPLVTSLLCRKHGDAIAATLRTAGAVLVAPAPRQKDPLFDSGAWPHVQHLPEGASAAAGLGSLAIDDLEEGIAARWPVSRTVRGRPLRLRLTDELALPLKVRCWYTACAASLGSGVPDGFVSFGSEACKLVLYWPVRGTLQPAL